MVSTRQVTRLTRVIGFICCLGLLSVAAHAQTATRPNVIIIMTDDQGHGDLGFHGNPKVKTPNLDKFARESVRFENFYVSPVCSPTRASLMTGRYNYRTGIVDTFMGRSMMHPGEVTIAEMLTQVGYRTGIFGKWHLGDNYPMRAMDQGFQESLVCRGGGIGQPSDPPGNTYFDPVLQQNGKPVKKTGYCTDIFTDAAIDFITRHRGTNFFAYIPYNAPHAPLQVPDKYLEIYKAMNLAPSEFPAKGHPIPANTDADTTARVYAMVHNIDDNVGRLLAKLDELKLRSNTIVMFLTDNGPQHPRYTSGMFERKGSTHEGGIRVPFFLRWPGMVIGDRSFGLVTAHIDIVPTLLDFCALPRPRNVEFDGRSLAPLLMLQVGQKFSWPDRMLFFQWHRGDAPELYRNFAARSQRYKLVQPAGAGNQSLPPNAPFKLYDMLKDPLEQTDIAAQHPDIVQTMRTEYEAWFKYVGEARGYEPPRIYLGAPQENPTTLTRQDWRGPQAQWNDKGLGHWEVQITRTGAYTFNAQFPPVSAATVAELKLDDLVLTQNVPAGASNCVFKTDAKRIGPARLQAAILQGTNRIGAHYIEVTRLEAAQ
ncbi:MAG: arylsulfatase [Verrucomicrobiota bacterium]